jgi:hypothetical protein
MKKKKQLSEKELRNNELYINGKMKKKKKNAIRNNMARKSREINRQRK